MNEPDEITIPLWVLVIPAIALMILLGWHASPRNEDGRPLLLLPDTKAVEEYRRFVVIWSDELRLVDGEIAVILANDTTDLFGQSRHAQRAFEHILEISQDIDRHEAPPTMLGLRESLNNASSAYLESSRLTLRWLSLPEQANMEQAQQTLSDARSNLQNLESSQWLVKRSP
jgi:hypothetical protein